MALKLQMLEGFEQGLLTAIGVTTGGTPTIDTGLVRSGAAGTYIINCPNSTATSGRMQLSINQNGTLNANKAAGIWFNASAIPGAGVWSTIAQFQNGNTDVFQMQIGNVDEVRFNDTTNGVLATSTSSPLTAATWHLLEWFVIPGGSSNGSGDITIDGVSACSFSATTTRTDNCDNFEVLGRDDVSTGQVYFDDFYCLDEATGTGDYYGDIECVALQGDGTTSTGGDALETGSWANAMQQPFVDNDNGYTSDPASDLEGYCDTQGGSRAGPSGNSDIDGDSNIKGAVYVFWASRGGGSGTGDVKTIKAGNATDGLNASKDISATIGTNPGSHYVVSEAANVVPTSSQFARLAITHNGARDFYLNDALVYIAHVPAAVVTPPGPQTFMQNPKIRHMVMR